MNRCKSCVWNVIDLEEGYKNHCKKGHELNKCRCSDYRSLDIKEL